MKEKKNIFVKNSGLDSCKGSFNSPVSLAGALKIAAKEKCPIVLYLFEGVYQISKTLCLGPELSNVEFRALSPGKVFWDGGKEILNWHKTNLSLSGKTKTQKVWIADVSELLSSFGEFKFLHVNGQHKPRCRYPANEPGITEKSISRISYDFPVSISSYDNFEDLELVLFYDWVCRRLKIKSIDEKGLDFIPDMTELGKETKFYIENLPLKFLAPGQWKLDIKTATVYYMPKEDESLEQTSISVAYTPQLLDICGNPEIGNYVENMLFEGIEFRHTGDDRLINSIQAEYDRSAAVTLSGALNCRFDNCGFSNTSGWGLEFAGGCRNNTVSRCNFINTGAGGIMANGAKLSGSPSVTGYNRFTDNTFLNGGRIWSSAVAILLCHSAGNQVSGNDISYYHYSGISCGWVWGYGENISKNNIISNNHIHHLGSEKLLADMGAIYTLGIQPGTILRGNIIHDISGENISWGIYLDEGSSNIVVENNLVYNVASECFHVHYGRDNIVRNNVFAFGGSGICSVTRGTMDMHCNFTPGDKAFESEQNIMLSSGSPFYVKNILDYDIKEDISCITSDHNIFQYTGTDETIFGADGFHNVKNTFEQTFGKKQWQEAGFDHNSLSVSQSVLPAEIKKIKWLSSPTIKLYENLLKNQGGIKCQT